MQVFRSNQSIVDGKLVLAFEGPIDEESRLPEVAANVTDLVIDLQFVKSINSYGIREWLNWIRPIAARAKINFVNCPKSIVLQFNTVEGFLPAGARVSSFYVPYFCEKCDRDKSVLFHVGKEVQKTASGWEKTYLIEGDENCEAKPCEMELDVTESKYFGFLKRLP
jgi:hypothetical protein